MAPPREEKTVDAGRVTFSWDKVIVVAGIVAGFYAATYELRSDVRDILTRMEYQSKIDERDNRMINDRVSAAESLIKTHIAEYKLEGYDYKTLEARLLALERRRP